MLFRPYTNEFSEFPRPSGSGPMSFTVKSRRPKRDVVDIYNLHPIRCRLSRARRSRPAAPPTVRHRLAGRRRVRARLQAQPRQRQLRHRLADRRIRSARGPGSPSRNTSASASPPLPPCSLGRGRFVNDRPRSDPLQARYILGLPVRDTRDGRPPRRSGRRAAARQAPVSSCRRWPARCRAGETEHKKRSRERRALSRLRT